MKAEEIDLRIGMPDIDLEWAKFKEEFIGIPSAKRGFFISPAAAVAIVIVSVSLTALGSAYIFRVMPAQRAARQQVTTVPDTVCSIPVVPDTMFIFDDVEMEIIANTLGDHYGLKPQFKDEKARHYRLYARIKKSATIDEVTTLLNNFKKVKLSVRKDQLVVESIGPEAQ